MRSTSDGKRWLTLPINGAIGSAGPGAIGLRWWNRQHAATLHPRQLPATLMDHPVVAVAEQDQVAGVGGVEMGWLD
jgi:hypothetical protein